MTAADAVDATSGSLSDRSESVKVEQTLSVIIAVYEDWATLESCLTSLAGQVHAPVFEVIVVDDGSRQATPQSFSRWATHFPLSIERQEHAGIAAARNRGVELARGSVLLFVDTDCQLEPECLAELMRTVTNSPHSHCFQLRLGGALDGIVGRAEELRLRTLEENLIQDNGCIRYLNTAGFAIRRSRISPQQGLFKTGFLRGEDTVLLAELMLEHELPLFVPNAVVHHAIRLSLLKCFWKDIRVAGLSREADDFIAARGLKIRMNSSERLAAMIHMWKTSRSEGIGRTAWFVVMARQGIQRASSLVRIFSR